MTVTRLTKFRVCLIWSCLRQHPSEASVKISSRSNLFWLFWREFRVGLFWFGMVWDNINLKVLWKFYQDPTCFKTDWEYLVMETINCPFYAKLSSNFLEMLSHQKILYYNQWQNKCNFKKGFGKPRKFLNTETAGQDLHRLIGAGVRWQKRLIWKEMLRFENDETQLAMQSR